MTAAATPAGKSSSNATRLRRERAAEKAPAATAVPTVGANLVHPPIGSIEPSPHNPRKDFDAEALDELAASIRENGVLQPILIREAGPLRYEIVAGERRWRAARLAGLTSIPAVLLEAGGESAARVARIVENEQRRGLKPLELADAIADLLSMGLTQAEAGKRVGISQSRVAHILKLRELPDEVRQVLAGGQLSAAHGEALTKWSAFPAFAALLARSAASGNWTARRIATPDFDELDQVLDEEYAEADEAPVLWTNLGYDVLDRAKCATECPFGAFVDQDDGNYRSRFCLKPAHAVEIQEQLRAERLAPRLAPDTSSLVAAARAAAQWGGEDQQWTSVAGVAKPVPAPLPPLEIGDRVRHSQFGDGSILEAKPHAVLIKPDNGDKEFWTGLNAFGGGKIVLLDEDGHASAHTPEAATAPKIPSLSDLGYGRYEQITSRAPSACRAGTCPCFGKARNWNGGDLVEICTEPARFKSIVAAATKARNAENKRRHVEAVSKVEDRVRAHAAVVSTRDLLLVLQQVVANGAYRPTGATFSEAWEEAARWLKPVKMGATTLSKAELDKIEATVPSDQLLRALVEAICRQDLALRFSPEGGASFGALADWYVGGGLPKRADDDWQPAEKGAKA